MIRKCVWLALAFLVVGSVTTGVEAKSGKGNPGVVPASANFRGMSYGEWGAEWWKAVFAIPVVDDDHPLFSGGALPGPKGVVFLTGVSSDPNPAEIEITIRPGTPLFFPIINVECSVFEGDGNNEAELRACANGHVDHTSGRFAIIDGKPVAGLDNYRADSPLYEWGPLPEGNIFEYVGFNAPAGTTSPSVADGYWLLLHPLSVGRHVIEFGGTFDETGDVIYTRYIITVSP